MRGTWNGSGGGSAASAVRWRAARDVAHEWTLHAWRVEVGRQLAAVGGDGNSTVAVATGELSERAPGAVGLSAGTVALGRAQFCAQCCFAFIQILLRFQNTK
jgi:hypothetical protein